MFRTVSVDQESQRMAPTNAAAARILPFHRIGGDHGVRCLRGASRGIFRSQKRRTRGCAEAATPDTRRPTVLRRRPLSDAEIFPVPKAWAQKAHMNAAAYEAAVQRVEEDPEGYWRAIGERLDWMTPFTQVKDVSFAKDDFHIRWFADGVLNVSANCMRNLKLTPILTPPGPTMISTRTLGSSGSPISSEPIRLPKFFFSVVTWKKWK